MPEPDPNRENTADKSEKEAQDELNDYKPNRLSERKPERLTDSVVNARYGFPAPWPGNRVMYPTPFSSQPLVSLSMIKHFDFCRNRSLSEPACNQEGNA